MKKTLILLLSILMGISLMACSDSSGSLEQQDKKTSKSSVKKVKVGFVYLGNLEDYGYAFNHNAGRIKLGEALGVQTVGMDNVSENLNDGKAIDDLVAQGCNVIYGTSMEYMDSLANAAEKYPNVYFGHATGYLQFANLSNYMGRIYEIRYLSGIIAGLSTKTNKIGYIGAMPTPEIFRGINAFALGVKSVNKDAIVEVEWTNAWNYPELERRLAEELVDKGVDILTHHTDNIISQVVADERNIMGIGYNGSNREKFPKSNLTSALFNWEVFYIDDVKAILDGTWTSRSYYEGLAKNMVTLDAINEVLVAQSTIEAVEKARQEIIDKKLHIFAGPIYDDHGTLQVEEGFSMSDSEILSMIFLVDNVVDNLGDN